MNDDARLNWLRRTPWNQIHRTDSSLLNHYQLKTGIVVVVSLLEQCMRVYQNGQLIKAFQVRAGSDEVSSLPGSWQVIQRQEDVTVMSSFPKGSAFWYPPTPIQYLLTYHTGGYTILGSWWSTSYGRGTNFPHDNASGNAERNNGLSAGVWLSSENMAWLYNHVQMNTSVVIY